MQTAALKQSTNSRGSNRNPSKNKSELIFIVDDDPIYRELVHSHFVTLPKAKVMTFSCGEDCLKQMHRKPALVLLDYDLEPNMLNGVEVLTEIKSNYPDTEVVILSGWDDVSVVVSSMRMGAADYVVKNESALISLKTRAQHLFKRNALQRKVDEDKSFRQIVVMFIAIIAMFSMFLYILMNYK